ncbi:MAG: hypothetical protein KDJ88_21875, partial [Bauldia sp.]|nr:hypothetical protein [Bauldia sp.]
GGFGGGGGSFHGSSGGGGGHFSAPNFQSSGGSRQHHQDYDTWHNTNTFYNHWGTDSSNPVQDPLKPGTIFNATPSGCKKVVENGKAYRQCGSQRYAPRYQGSNVVYQAQ